MNGRNTQMKKFKLLFWALLLGMIVIQFIRPARNTSGQAPAQSFIDTFKLDDSIRKVLTASCFDCHSNNTRYPWYANIQPVGWVMSGHIRNGKEKLNFDDVASYGPRKRKSKFREIKEQIEQDKMPLPSYKILHKDARLTVDQKNILLHWFENLSNN